MPGEKMPNPYSDSIPHQLLELIDRNRADIVIQEYWDDLSENQKKGALWQAAINRNQFALNHFIPLISKNEDKLALIRNAEKRSSKKSSFIELLKRDGYADVAEYLVDLIYRQVNLGTIAEGDESLPTEAETEDEQYPDAATAAAPAVPILPEPAAPRAAAAPDTIACPSRNFVARFFGHCFGRALHNQTPAVENVDVGAGVNQPPADEPNTNVAVRSSRSFIARLFGR